MNKINFVSALFLILTLVSCAKENSKEDVESEQRSRAQERLTPATGQYDGYIKNLSKDRKSTLVVPVSVFVDTKYVSSQPSANLRVGLRIGLFGGVYIYTYATVYEFKTGFLSASFNRGGTSPGAQPGGIPLPGASAPGSGSGDQTSIELRATILNHVISNVTLNPAHDSPKPVVFSESAKGLFSSASEYNYNLKMGSGSPLLFLTPRTEGEVAPDNIDLPLIPSLIGGLHFPGIPIPHNFQRIIYDPLKGHVDLIFSSANRITIDGVGLPMDVLKGSELGTRLLDISVLKGSYFQGGVKVSDLQGSIMSDPAQANALAQTSPPNFFVGTYRNPQGDSTNVSATLDLLTQEFANPSEFPFSTFPGMTLKLFFCQSGVGNNIGARMNMNLVSLDEIHSQVLFRDLETVTRELVVTYGGGFSALSGRFRSPQGLGSSTLNLRAEAASRWKGCF